MLKHLGLLCLVIIILIGCKSNTENPEQPEITTALQELKLDSVRSVITIIVNDGDLVKDARTNISAGAYKIDGDSVIRFVNFHANASLSGDNNQQIAIDMINLEEWDSTQVTAISFDSTFTLTEVSHLALSHITIGDITNEVLLPIKMNNNRLDTYIEGKATLTLKSWGFDLQEEYKLHLGLSLYTLSEN